MGAEIFRESFETGGIDRLIADLAPEFAFYHTALAYPTTDRELLRRILVTARKTIGEDFRFTEQLRATASTRCFGRARSRECRRRVSTWCGRTTMGGRSR